MTKRTLASDPPISVMVDCRWNKNSDGIGRYSNEITKRLATSNALDTHFYSPSRSPLSPLDPFLSSFTSHAKGCHVFYSPGFNVPISFPGNTVFTIHDLIHLSVKEEQSVAKRLYYELHIKSAIRSAFKVITVSEYSKSEIVRWAKIDPDKIVIAPNGVAEIYTPKAFRADLHDDNYLLYVGNHKPHKNIHRLLVAFSQAALPEDWKLYLSGSADESEKALIDSLGISERIRFLGFVEENDLPALYASARALVFVSILEGFGLPALEAMACSTPVIAANNSSLPEILGGAGLLVDPFSIDEIAEAMRRIATDTILARSLSQRGCERAKQFNWDTSYQIIERILREAASHAN